MVRKGLAALLAAGSAAGVALWLRPAASEVNQVKQVSPGVYFHEGDLHGHGHCNNGWIVLDDYVVVVDANFPSGAQVVIPKIKATSEKPIRFVFDTHHHGDHAYGNQVWADQGAIPVATQGAMTEFRKYEPKLFGGSKPGRWEEGARDRPDVASSRLKLPTLLFPRELAFDDGKHRVELRHLGVAHTHGDGFAWLPKERILFTGDACVNGPFNYTGDGNVHQWIKTLDAAKKLQPKTVVPGHGAIADASLLDDQQTYFRTLIAEVTKLKAKYPAPKAAQARTDSVRQVVLKNPRIKKYVGDMFASQVEKVWGELGGTPFPKSAKAGARTLHARDHRLNLLELGPPREWDTRLTRRK